MKLTQYYASWPKGVPYTLAHDGRTVCARLQQAAERAPKKTAIDFYGAALSFGDFWQQAQMLAGYLQQRLDVKPGDRVMIQMQSCPQFCVAYYSILMCGAVVVAVSAMSTTEELANFVEDAGAQVLISTQDMQERFEPLLESGMLRNCVVSAYSEAAGSPQSVPFMRIPEFVTEARRALTSAQIEKGMHDFKGAIQAGCAWHPVELAPEDLAVIGYTSGTTGKPKGAMLKHEAFALVVAQRSLWFSGSPDCSDLVVLPINHIAGMCSINQAICEGRTMVLLARWDASAVPALIERHRIDRWATVAPMLAELLDRPELDRHDVSSLKRLYGGAIAMPEALARAVRERFGVPYLECYGMTEMCGSAHMNPPAAPRLACAGIPQINIDARVIDPESGMELGPNQQGEMVMHGPMQFSGYWNQPQATQEAFIELDGKPFVRSGDVGYYDKDGYFYVTDRLKRMINAAGLKVWPAEIEACLFMHPMVKEVCVIAALDSRRGETVKAMVVLKPESVGQLSGEELEAWARARLAAYKVPRIVEFVDGLPKTSAGKVMWRLLQDQQAERDREQIAEMSA